MRKFFNGVKWVGGILGTLIFCVFVLGAILAFQSAMESNVKEQAYAQGQHDILNESIDYLALAKNTEGDSEQARKYGYAQGLSDAAVGDIRVKAITDSTYVWTKSPWGKDNPIPSDTILIKK